MKGQLELLLIALKEQQTSLGEEIEENNEWMGEDFNPCDASGGNFDDAYEMGVGHGETDGMYTALCNIINVLEAILGTEVTE